MASAAPDAVLHLAALHALASAGFASTSSAASMTLTDVVARYLRLLATTSVERAAFAGRSKVAAIDVVRTLEDLGLGDVGELQEWALDLDSEVVFAGSGMDELADQLRDGLQTSGGTELHFRPSEMAEPINLDETEADSDMEIDDVKEDRARQASPGNWLPPLPTAGARAVETVASASTISNTSAPQTIADRYRQPISFASSQLGQSRAFTEPPKHPRRPLPSSPSSFPSLLESYSTSEPNPPIAMSEMRYRQINLLRYVVSTPDNYSPRDTLTSPIPGPRLSPIVPSHSDKIPQHLLPINPSSTGVLSSLVHKLNSPHLPAALRERLTSLRPPQAQMRDGKPILYGDPIRGPDTAQLSKARGKLSEEGDQAWLSATWDSGPRGMDKWGRGRLPSGRKVVQSGEGEAAPREPEETRRLKLKISAAEGEISTPGTSGIKIRLGSRRESSAAEGSGGTDGSLLPVTVKIEDASGHSEQEMGLSRVMDVDAAEDAIDGYDHAQPNVGQGLENGVSATHDTGAEPKMGLESGTGGGTRLEGGADVAMEWDGRHDVELGEPANFSDKQSVEPPEIHQHTGDHQEMVETYHPNGAVADKDTEEIRVKQEVPFVETQDHSQDQVL